jgi:hypothetical protein
MITAALALHRHILDAHSRDGELLGPDHGVRVNYRLGRFVKSYLRALPWRDQLYYLQGQAYWVLANWRLHALLDEPRYGEIATRCSERMLARQRSDGAWDYPNREWKGRIATAEGGWASIGLLDTHLHTRNRRLLDGALRWNDYVDEHVGYESVSGNLAVNYFGGRPGSAVPNNSAFTLRLLAELAAASADETYLRRCPSLLGFLGAAQLPSGELPYELALDGGVVRQHFQCYQYNAFQCLDLISYLESTGDRSAEPIIAALLRFLSGGVAADGHVFYDCSHGVRRVTYHTAVVAAAFARAGQCGLDVVPTVAPRAFEWVVSQQQENGGFPHSLGDYRVLSDRRSYPRNLSMILYHLTIGCEGEAAPPRASSPGRATERES